MKNLALRALTAALALTSLTALATHQAPPSDAVTGTVTTAAASKAKKDYSTIKFSDTKVAKTKYGCFKVGISGSARAERTTWGSRLDIQLGTVKVNHRHPTFIAPRIWAKKLTSCKAGAKYGGTVHQLELTQLYFRKDCSANLSYSAGFPWGVSVGAAPGCKKAEALNRTEKYTGEKGKRGELFSQDNTGVRVSFKQVGSGHSRLTGRKTLCVRAAGRLTYHKSGSKSDTTDVAFKGICWTTYN